MKLSEKFPGGRKHWEPFNAAIINKMMDNVLAIFIDIATCLHLYMQLSLQSHLFESSDPDAPPLTPGMTPKTKHRLANEM